MFDKPESSTEDTRSSACHVTRLSSNRPYLTDCPDEASMRARLIPLLFITAFWSLQACDFKASEEECKLACDNVAKVGHSEVEQKIAETKDLADSGEGRMARSMASAMVDAIKDECMKQCKDKGTRKLTECLQTSDTVEQINRCL